VDLNPTRGSEQAGYRPVLVVSPDEMNANLNTVIVAPLNTRLRGWPTRVRVEHDAEIRQTTGLDVASQNDSRMEFGLAEVQPSIPASRFA
jgi:mRNA interferase MazF